MIQRKNYPPADALQEYVDSYGIVEVPEGQTEPYFSPPLAMSGMIIQTINTNDSMIVKLDAEDFFTDQAVVTGQVTSSVHGQMIGHTKSLLIFFKTLGMHQLFGTDMYTLTNRADRLKDFLGVEKSDALLNALKASQKDEDQIEVLNKFFLDQVNSRHQVDDLNDILDYIHFHKGNITVAEIEEKFDIRRKTLERNFQKKVGLSPKEYAKIYRFKCLLTILMENPGITWTELSHRAGFYDQSHMSRYVKEYLKVSPNNIVQLDMELINFFLRNETALLRSR